MNTDKSLDQVDNNNRDVSAILDAQSICIHLGNEAFKIYRVEEMLSRFFLIGLPEIRKDITRLLFDLSALPEGISGRSEIVLLNEIFDFINDLEENTSNEIIAHEAFDNDKRDYDGMMNRNITLLEECVQLREEMAILRKEMVTLSESNLIEA